MGSMQHTTEIETNEIHGYLERAWIARGVDADRLAKAMHAEGWRYDWKRDSLGRGETAFQRMIRTGFASRQEGYKRQAAAQALNPAPAHSSARRRDPRDPVGAFYAVCGS